MSKKSEIRCGYVLARVYLGHCDREKRLAVESIHGDLFFRGFVVVFVVEVGQKSVRCVVRGDRTCRQVGWCVETASGN